MTRRFTSLKSMLFAWLALATGVVLSVNLIVSLSSALHFANTAYDSTLFGAAHTMAGGINVRRDSVEVVVPAVALEMLGADRGRPVFYRVRSPDGRMLAGFRDAPEPPVRMSRGPVYFDAVYRGIDLRWIAMYVPVLTSSESGFVLVQVGEPKGLRELLSHRIVLATLLQQLPLALLAGCAVWWGVRKSLRPLESTGRQIGSRSERDLRPINEDGIPREVLPLIRAINDLLRRASREMEIQQAFIADASHQLKTPLAILKANAELALRQRELEPTRTIIVRISDTIAQTSRLTHQLLSLLSVDARANMPKTVVDLSDTVARVTADRVPWALARGIDLGIETGDRSVPVLADGVLIAELVGNLVDNAVRYCNPGGSVTVGTTLQDGMAVLTVTDDGPGIAPEFHETVFRRFTTVGNQGGDSCGLGLAIVRQIAEAHDGTVALSNASGGRGLTVTVRLPAMAAAPQISALEPVSVAAV